MSNIQTERLIIRPFSDKDAPDLLAYMSQPSVNCFADERIHTLAEAQADIKVRMKDELQFAVATKDNNHLIGHLFAHQEDDEGQDTYSVGWHFNPTYSGQGYATEAADALLNYLFNDKSARRIYAYVEEDNIPSQNLCKRLGMRQEGTFIEFISFVKNPNGTDKYENTQQYAILKKEWQSLT